MEDYLALGFRMSDDERDRLGRQIISLTEAIMSMDRKNSVCQTEFGIVVNGGGEMLEPAITAIWSLRQSGSEYPVALWMHENEIPNDEVKTLLKVLNTTIRIYEHVSPARFVPGLGLGLGFEQQSWHSILISLPTNNWLR